MHETRFFVFYVTAFITLHALSSRAYALNCDSDSYLVGAAQGDITGPISGIGMMGYADPQQVSQGLHMRLRSRALVLTDSCNLKTVALVINELAMIFSSLKNEILTRLSLELPGVFHEGNLLLSATHTHSGPGGYSQYRLYNLTTLGFSRENHEKIVSGTVLAIIKAYRNREKAYLKLNRGEVQGLQFNRSPEAYKNNPSEERSRFGRNFDPQMTLLSAVSENGKILAAWNWFPVHGVSLPRSNKLVSSDNKGFAAYLLERSQGTTYQGDHEFIAGFVQSHAGDISPYPINKELDLDVDGMRLNEESGHRQFLAAKNLLDSADTPIRGPIQISYTLDDPSEKKIAGGRKTCRSALGVSFAAGTENGKPFPFFYEGTVYGKTWPSWTLMPKEQACHKEKVILLPTGILANSRWIASAAPLQIVRIGNLAVVAVPFEITTMAGRRLLGSLSKSLSMVGVDYVVLTALANEYLHYVTTPEEYALQAYEGGSNLFGPFSLDYFQERYQELMRLFADGGSIGQKYENLKSQRHFFETRPGPFRDGLPFGKSFGEVMVEPELIYEKSSLVIAKFYGAHPIRGTSSIGSFLTVEQKTTKGWVKKYFDWDPETLFFHRLQAGFISEITVKWNTRRQVTPGVFRICHEGKAKGFLTSGSSDYRGCTREFRVVPKKGGVLD